MYLMTQVKTADSQLQEAQQGRGELSISSYSSNSNSYLLIRVLQQIIRVSSLLIMQHITCKVLLVCDSHCFGVLRSYLKL